MTSVANRSRALQFVVVVLFALALVPVGAHLLARPNKIGLPQEQYFTTQAVYLGWGLPTSIVLIAAIEASLALTIAVRGQGAVFWLVLAGFVLITATLVIYSTGHNRPTAPPRTGRPCRTTGANFVRNGNSAIR